MRAEKSKVNGCFWHGYGGCSVLVPPESNQDYWIPKIERSGKRGAEMQNELTMVECNCCVGVSANTYGLLLDCVSMSVASRSMPERRSVYPQTI